MAVKPPTPTPAAKPAAATSVRPKGPFVIKPGVKVGNRVAVQGYGVGTVRFVGAHHIDGRPR